MSIIETPTVEGLRRLFPALGQDFVFLENAGGSQIPSDVADAIRDYTLDSYVQLGAPYAISAKATETVAKAHAFANRMMNGDGLGYTIIGPSTTQLCHMLAGCYAEILQEGDEIIIAETAHEANAGPWARLEARGAKVKWWRIDPATFDCSLDGLVQLLSSRTRLLALPHVSNLLGDIVDLKEITELAHRYGVRVVADGVAHAPHREIDVAYTDVDFYVFSWYKVYGPHAASMFGKSEAWAELTGPNHFFIPKGEAYKFELGGPSHEACAGILAVEKYLSFLGSGSLRDAFRVATELELPLQKRLIEYLAGRSDVRIIGPLSSGTDRVPTISFVHDGKSSEEIAGRVCDRGIGIRNGHMYAYRMCEALGLDLDRGVVRISAVHYNTVEEIERLIEALDETL